MNDEHSYPNNLIDTTDCLEAVGVFRAWKNFLFVIIVLCFLLLQISFWFVNTGFVKADDRQNNIEPAVEVVEEKSKIEEAAKQVVSEKPGEQQDNATEQPQQAESDIVQQSLSQNEKPLFRIKLKYLTRLVNILNHILIPASVLYCLTLIFSLKVSLAGRLGGINHISRAFFLSLVAVVLLFPWQKFFVGMAVGVIYTPSELLAAHEKVQSAAMFRMAIYYLRYVGLWLVTLLFFIFAQIRSSRWAKSILKRLEVI